MKSFLIAALALSLSACGGASDPKALNEEGSMALGSGKYADAAKSYEKALAALGTDTASPEWKRAKMGWIQAETRIDAAQAKAEFLKYAKENPTQVTDADYSLVASKLGDAEKFEEATELLAAGQVVYPKSTQLDALGKDLANRAKASGASGALDKLKGLGYVGD